MQHRRKVRRGWWAAEAAVADGKTATRILRREQSQGPPMPADRPVAVVTGANRGIGRDVTWAVLLPDDGPTGTFTRDGRPLPW